MNVTFEKNKLYIKILAEPLGDNSFSPNSKSLNNLMNILQDHAEQTINTQTSEKKKGAIIKLITFKIDAANLSEVTKILEAKAPLKAKGDIKKVIAKKLESTDKKDREII